MIQEQTRTIETVETIRIKKPLLRGWFHAVAAIGAVVLTVALCWTSRGDIARMISMLIFGLSMIELYTMSAIYHIGEWSVAQRRVLRTIDHANIFILIAGTYTPLCFNVLSGWFRIVMLLLIWSLAVLGVCLSFFTLKLPRWVLASLYIGMGWVALLAIPVFITKLPWMALATLALGGILYTIGAVIYARKKPDPFPKVLGFHEIFHLFVIAGGVAFAACIWIWAVPFPRM
jgi:hemolysin III